MPPQDRPPLAVLCEQCGYPVAGLDPAGACPECGRDLARSRPARRVGSPWQRRPSLRAWVATSVLYTLHPIRAFDLLAHGPGVPHGPLRVNALLGGLAIALAGAIGSVFMHLDIILLHTPGRRAAVTTFAIVGLVAWPALVVALTAIETAGVRFFGTRRGWRLTRTLARTITAHGSVGWLIAGLLGAAGLLASPIVQRLGTRVHADTLREALVLAPYWLPAAGAFVGLMHFETLAYIGMRRCRFASPAPHATYDPTDPPA